MSAQSLIDQILAQLECRVSSIFFNKAHVTEWLERGYGLESDVSRNRRVLPGEPASPRRAKARMAQLKRCINETFGAEIDGTDDPDHLNHVLADLYRIEDALDLDMKPLIQDIYFTLDDAGLELEDDGLAGEFVPVYYLRADGPGEQDEVMRQLGMIRGEVDGMFPRFE